MEGHASYEAEAPEGCGGPPRPAKLGWPSHTLVRGCYSTTEQGKTCFFTTAPRMLTGDNESCSPGRVCFPSSACQVRSLTGPCSAICAPGTSPPPHPHHHQQKSQASSGSEKPVAKTTGASLKGATRPFVILEECGCLKPALLFLLLLLLCFCVRTLQNVLAILTEGSNRAKEFR